MSGLFTKDMEVIKLADLYLKSYSFDVLTVCFIFCINGYLNSIGKSWFSLVHGVFAIFCGRLPLSYFLSEIEGATLFTIGWAAPLSSMISVILCFGFLIYLRQSNKEIQTV